MLSGGVMPGLEYPRRNHVGGGGGQLRIAGRAAGGGAREYPRTSLRLGVTARHRTKPHVWSLEGGGRSDALEGGEKSFLYGEFDAVV